MSVWTDILDKLGIHRPATPAMPADKPADKPMTWTPTTAFQPNKPTAAPMQPVDVMSKLDKLAGKESGLDWKVSIVDLMKLLGIDSSLNNRKALAKELGCPPDLMGGDSAKMNVWLHKTVLQKIAENGGNIPKELLD